MQQSNKERLLAKIVIDSGGCWKWTAGAFDSGYGAISVGGKMRKAHRVAYEAFVGTIPLGMCVCHRCDTPCCINPDHLFLGSHADNTADMLAKERHGLAKLTAQQVVVVRQFLSRHKPRPGVRAGPVPFLARWFGVSMETIRAARSRRTWRHVS